ncbi:hypothetical protein [Mesorhizobium sp. M0809]|uniref:hypothetical protein n=1 Tax=Mesorhizobium sp. M0809 TaxID=2957003 RepID=UPI003339D54B
MNLPDPTISTGLVNGVGLCSPLIKSTVRATWSHLIVDAEASARGSGSRKRTDVISKLSSEEGFRFGDAADLKGAMALLADSAQLALGEIGNQVGGVRLARTALVEEARGTLERASVLNIVGAPGAGKSSVLPWSGEGLAYIAHVVDMKVDEFAESFQARYTGLSRRLTAIDLALGFGRPAPCVVSAQEGLADVATFATDLDTPGTGRELCVGGHFVVCAPCALRDRNMARKGSDSGINSCALGRFYAPASIAVPMASGRSAAFTLLFAQ